MIKILILAGDVNRIGGIEKYNRDLISSLKKQNVNVSVVERKEGGLLQKILFLTFAMVRVFAFQPHYIHCGHLNFSIIVLFAHKILRKKYSIALYGIEVLHVESNLRKKAIRHAHQIITISHYTKSFIIRQFPEVEKRIHMLESAIDENVFFIKDRKIELLDKHKIGKSKVILTLSRLSTNEEKGQDRVLEALKIVKTKNPEIDFKYLIVGSGEDMRVKEFLAREDEIRNLTRLAGAIKDEEKIDYYNLADIFILPSKLEGFGIVFIEALACGVPVIASDGFGCREGLLDGKLGMLVKPDNIADIAQKITQALTKQGGLTLPEREYLRNTSIGYYGKSPWEKKITKYIANIQDSGLKK